MRIKLFALLILLSAAGFLQAQKGFRDDVFLKTDSVINIQYGEAKTINGSNQKLLLNVFRPSGPDSMKYRPLVIYLPGGHFQGGSRSGGFSSVLCHVFARRGYVAAAIDYRSEADRSGYYSGKPEGAYTAYTEAVYRAQQDGRAAVRFFRRYYEQYGIDTSQIFMAGSAFGATACLCVAYMDEDEVPAAVSRNTWGDLEGSGGHAGYSSKVQAVLNIGGTIPDYTRITPGDAPVFHSADPYEGSPVFDSSGTGGEFNFGGYELFERCLEMGIATGWWSFENSGNGIDADMSRPYRCLRSMADWLYTQLTYHGAGKEKGEEVFRLEEDIEAFDAQNRVSRYASGTILFIGSDLIRLWNTLPDDLGNTRIVNRGFGGSNLRDVAYYIDRIISPFDAKAIFLYVDNDIVGKDTDASPDQVPELYKYIVKRIRMKFPDIPVVWLALFPNSKSREVRDRRGEVNRLIKKYNAGGDALYYLDCRKKFMSRGGKPYAACYRNGTFFLNERGYRRWATCIRKTFYKIFSE